MASHPVRAVRVAAHIPASPDDVFAFIADTRNDPMWCSNVDTVEQVSDDGVQAGSRFRFHQHLDRLRRARLEFDVEVEVVALNGRSITWNTTDRFQTRTITVTVEPDGTGSRITQVTQASFVKPPGAVKWVYPIVARRTLKQQFADLAAYFESAD